MANVQIEMELLTSVPIWEEEHGLPFNALGERVVETIENALAAKEAAKEAKKVSPQMRKCDQADSQRAKMGLAPGTARGTTPGPGARSQPGTVARKRVAPTPGTARPGTMTKRPRVVSSSTASTLGSSTTSSMRYPHGPSATPTAHAAARTQGRAFGKPAVGARANGTGRAPPPVYMSGSAVKQPQQQQQAKGAASAALGKGDRPRRQSFRPRPSLAGALLAGAAAGMMGGLAEDDDEDVF